jgi:hypothetical protein
MPLCERGRCGFVDRNFRWEIPAQYDGAGEFSDGLAEIRLGMKSGYIGKRGQEVIPPKYDMAWAFNDGLGRVRIDLPTGRKMMTVEGPEPVHQELYGFVDREGKESIPLQFEWATDFHEGYAFVKPQGSALHSIIDKQGRLLHEARYEQAGEFSEGVAAARAGGKWGYVDHNGSWVIAPQFATGDRFWHGLARVSWEDGHGYVEPIRDGGLESNDEEIIGAVLLVSSFPVLFGRPV